MNVHDAPILRCSAKCAGNRKSTCGGESKEFTYTLLRTAVESPRRANSTVAMVGMCAKGFSCTGLFREVVHDYVARHKLDLHMQSSTLEPTLPVAYSKLPQLQRLLRFGYEWIWRGGCPARERTSRTPHSHAIPPPPPPPRP